MRFSNASPTVQGTTEGNTLPSDTNFRGLVELIQVTPVGPEVSVQFPDEFGTLGIIGLRFIASYGSDGSSQIFQKDYFVGTDFSDGDSGFMPELSGIGPGSPFYIRVLELLP